MIEKEALPVEGSHDRESFGREAEAALLELYNPVGAKTPLEKFNVLKRTLGGEYNFYAMGGSVNDEMKLACLEYEYLVSIGKIKVELA